MVAEPLLRGLLVALVPTISMLPVEILAYRRHGLRGVFEWHEIHASLFGFQSRRPLGASVVAMHFVFGGVAGVIFLLGAGLLLLPPVPSGVAFGFALWIGTVLLHEWATAVDPWRNEMGRNPALASLTGHLVYGIVLGLAASVPV